MRTLVFGLAVVWAIPAQAGQVQVTNVEQLVGAIADAQPGDEIIVASGTYNVTGFLALASTATADAPIVIHSAGADRPILSRTADDAQNWLVLTGSYVTLRNLDLSGGARGIVLNGNADHITVDSCILHDMTSSAIAANFAGATYSSLTFTSNEIYNISGSAEAFYIGCAASACTIDTVTIVGNYVHDSDPTGGGTMTNILVRNGVTGAEIRDNVVANSPGAWHHRW